MSSVVVLTKYHAYWGERSLHDTIRLFCRGKIEILKADQTRMIKAGINREGVTVMFPVPLVVRLLDFVGIQVKRPEVRFTYEAVFNRDKNICQYWHVENGKRYKHRCTSIDRTIDHIIPQSRGGRDTFENCACACRTCNERRKKNLTPSEAGMHLIRKPEAPKRNKGDMVVITFTFNPNNEAHKAYFDYMGVSFNEVAG